MPVTRTGLLSQVNMAVVRQCAATFIELVKKVAFVNELWTLEDHFLHTEAVAVRSKPHRQR